MADMTTEQKAEAWDKLMEKLDARIAETEPLCDSRRTSFDFSKYGQDVYDANVYDCNFIELKTLEEVRLEMVADLFFELTGQKPDWITVE